MVQRVGINTNRRDIINRITLIKFFSSNNRSCKHVGLQCIFLNKSKEEKSSYKANSPLPEISEFLANRLTTLYDYERLTSLPNNQKQSEFLILLQSLHYVLHRALDQIIQVEPLYVKISLVYITQPVPPFCLLRETSRCATKYGLHSAR